MLIAAIVLISAALVLYTAGVWGERRSGELRPRHAVLFAAGLACDASGTWLMALIARSGTYTTQGTSAVLTTVMAITGALALVLMAAHLLWAVLVLWRGSDAPAARSTVSRWACGDCGWCPMSPAWPAR
ncbi:MAG: HsmA family protein [Propionibacteriaceae bacterium]|nr:HsmA family protein [Propionibacteriaceae bacterium]